jgi:hypothetical protein
LLVYPSHLAQTELIRRFSQHCEKRLLASSFLSVYLSVCLSVRPSVRMAQLGCQGMDFHEILHFTIFPKSVEELG